MSDYVAKVPLYIGHIRAARAGDKVSAEAVEEYGWHDLVTKGAGRRAAADEDEKPAPRKTTRRK